MDDAHSNELIAIDGDEISVGQRQGAIHKASDPSITRDRGLSGLNWWLAESAPVVDCIGTVHCLGAPASLSLERRDNNTLTFDTAMNLLESGSIECIDTQAQFVHEVCSLLHYFHLTAEQAL